MFMKTLQLGILFGLGVITLVGCSSSDTTGGGTTSGGTTGGSSSTGGTTYPATCSRGALEADFASFNPLSGPGVDPATGTLAPLPSTAVVSSTYLALKADPASQKRFGELMGPISKALAGQPGLLALQLGTSKSCVSARTRAVWKDEASMLGFVMGAAHNDAVASVGEVSRGESVVLSWATADVDEATWESATKRLAADEGPRY